jgi:hypothetical protein
VSKGNQLSLVKAAGQQPFFDWIEFGEFRPELADLKVRVRVNPPRSVRRNLSEIHSTMLRLNDELKTCTDEARIEEISAELKPLGERNVEIVASLLPTSDTDNTPMSVEAFNEFLKGDDDDDDTLETWFMRKVWEKVYNYFLSVAPSQVKSQVGNTP